MTNDISRLPRVAVSLGELIDKITILDLKAERMTDRGKVDNVRRERAILQAERDAHLPDDAAVRDLTDRLRSANGRLWDLEDAIRDCERRKDFGPAFIEAAPAPVKALADAAWQARKTFPGKYERGRSSAD